MGDKRLFDDDAYDLKLIDSRWVAYGLYGGEFEIRDTRRHTVLKVRCTLEEAWEIVQILEQYERTGKYDG